MVESNLFTRCTLAFYPKASGRHTGSSLGLRIYGNSVADIYLITSRIKFLPKFPINTYSQLVEMESRKCHPEFPLHWSNSTKCCSTQFPLCKQNSVGISELDVPKATLITLGWHSTDLQCAEANSSPGPSQRVSWLSLHWHGSPQRKTKINSSLKSSIRGRILSFIKPGSL